MGTGICFAPPNLSREGRTVQAGPRAREGRPAEPIRSVRRPAWRVVRRRRDPGARHGSPRSNLRVGTTGGGRGRGAAAEP